MSNITKLVSCYEVINKVQRTFKPQGSSWIKESIEDIGWAIQAIGYHAGFEKRSTQFPYLVVQNNRAKIPCDVERIIAIEQILPKSTFRNILNADGTTPIEVLLQNQLLNFDPSQVVDTDDNDAEERAIINAIDLQNLKVPSNCFQSLRMRKGSDITNAGQLTDPRTTLVQPNESYYDLNSDYVITSFSTGLIKLHYVGFAIDDKNYPKVIDDADYKMCIEWYLCTQLLYKGYKNAAGIDYKYAFEMYEMYRLRAENACKVMSLDSAETFRNSWSRYVQGSEISGDFFMNNEQPVYISES